MLGLYSFATTFSMGTANNIAYRAFIFVHVLTIYISSLLFLAVLFLVWFVQIPCICTYGRFSIYRYTCVYRSVSL